MLPIRSIFVAATLLASAPVLAAPADAASIAEAGERLLRERAQ